MDLAALLALIENLTTLSPEELASLEADLETAADERLDGERTDEALTELESIATALDAVRDENTRRETEQTERDERAAALADRIRGQADDDGEDADDDGEAESDEADAPAEEEAVTVEEESTEELETVAASGDRPRPRIGRVNARRPEGLPTRPPASGAALSRDIADWGLTAAAGPAGQGTGAPVRNQDDLARMFLDAIQASAGYRGGPRVKVPLVRSGRHNAAELYGESRFLTTDALGNERRIQAVTSPQGITAAGGRCAPSPVSYDLPVIGETARPVRDDLLTRFGADRAGVRTIPPPVIEDLEDAIGIWTEANDQNPSDPTTKPCLTVTCEEDDETVVQAITQCLRTGTFRQRYFGEQIEAWMRLAAVNHARTAEIELLTKVGSESTQVNVGQGLGATRDILAGLDRATAALASRHRDTRVPLRWGAPFWLLNMIRTDLAREMPGSSDERLAAADATILSFFRARNIVPSFFLDGEAGQIFGAQGDGPLLGWPSSVVTYLYPEGSWLFLDGGSLDVGLIRDSELVLVNDVMFFMETFEEAHFHGVESWRLTFDVCPDGTASGTVEFDPCNTGS